MTVKHKQFADEYIIKKNGTQAYLAVYPGVQASTAGANAEKLLKNTEIKAYIDSKLQEFSKNLGITFESQLKDLEWVKEQSKNDNDKRSYIAAIQEQNKMLGLNAPTKTETNLTINPVEELKKILNESS